MKLQSFQESNGRASSARLIFVIGSFWVMGMTTALAFVGKATVPELIAFYSAVQAVLVGLKLGQKPMENKDEK